MAQIIGRYLVPTSMSAQMHSSLVAFANVSEALILSHHNFILRLSLAVSTAIQNIFFNKLFAATRQTLSASYSYLVCRRYVTLSHISATFKEILFHLL